MSFYNAVINDNFAHLQCDEVGRVRDEKEKFVSNSRSRIFLPF